MRRAAALLLVHASCSLRPQHVSMSRRPSGVMRAEPERTAPAAASTAPAAASEPVAALTTEPEPTAEPATALEPSDARPASYNWTAVAKAPVGINTATQRLAARRAAATTDEKTIRVRWNDPWTVAAFCVFVPLLLFDEFLAISRGFICAHSDVAVSDLCRAVGGVG